MKSRKSYLCSILARTAIALAAVAAIVCFAPASLNAQGYGTISGTVSDPSGALVPGATVTAIQSQTGSKMVTTSGKDGVYVFPTLLPSTYSLSVIAAGFQTFTQTGIVLQANQALTANVSLRVGSQSQTVSVTSAPPQVNTTTGTLSQVIDESRVADLPLNGRNAAGLITLVAGVVDASNEGNGANQGNGKTFPAAVISSSNGTLPNQENFLLDGGNNTDEMTNVNDPFPFPDALQEFSVQTSNYDAQFGQSAGAVVNIVTKSGGSRFHGDAFEFLRNGYFNARPYFSPTADTLHRHQFGGTIGGPVIIPGLSHGKSTQFFFGYQHTLQHQSSTGGKTTVPTLAEEGLGSASYADYGNLCNTASGHSFNDSGICVDGSGTAQPSEQISNPFTNIPYAYNQVPASAFDPASVAYEKAFPTYTGTEIPGQIGGIVNYFTSTDQSYNEYIARVDHQFGSTDHLFGRYYYNYYIQPGEYDKGNLASYRSYFNTRYQNALIAETHTFTTNLLNNLVLNYQREIALRGGPPGSPVITDFGVKNIWQPPTGPFLSATVTGYFGATSSAFAAWARNNYTFNDDLHWVKGRHNFEFGGHFELSKFDVTNVYTSYGSFGFNSVTNKIGGATYVYPNAAANFQMGFMSSFGQGNYELVNDRNHFPGIYAQDSWRVTPRLQLNYGVRWEMFAPWADRVDQQTAFSPANYAANKGTPQFALSTTAGTPGLPAGMVLSGDPGFPSQGVRNQYKQFMPRVSFAYDVFGNGRTAVRGAFGTFYQDRIQAWMNLTQSSFVPNTISIALTDPAMYNPTEGANPGGPFSDPYCSTTSSCSAGAYANPFPFTKPFQSSQVFPNAFQVGEYDPSGNFHVPVTYDYNLTVERQLTSNMSLRLAYVGSGSRHLWVNLELNPEVNNGVGSANQRRVYNTAPVVGPCASNCTTSYAQIVEAAMIGNSHYNALQASLQQRTSHGLSFMFNYTWSKTYDDLPQNTRVSNTEDLNPGMSYVYPLYPTDAVGVPDAARASDIKALDRGPSDIDHPQVLSASYVYALPRLGSGNRVLRAVLNGWRTGGLIQHRSGDSLTAYMGTDVSLTGLGQDRAQQDVSQSAYSHGINGSGNCAAYKGPGSSCRTWLNKAAFSAPKNSGPGTGFGNVIKGSLRGPGVTNWDGDIVRSFPIYRETKLDFRVEYFDMLNHTELSNPQTSESNSKFGTITGTQGGPRIAQFALKYTF